LYKLLDENFTVNCRKFLPVPRLPSQRQSVTALWPFPRFSAC